MGSLYIDIANKDACSVSGECDKYVQICTNIKLIGRKMEAARD